MSCFRNSSVTLALGILCSIVAQAQTTMAQGIERTAPTEVSVTNEAISLNDSLGMKPYLNVERSSETRPGKRESTVQEISITQDALPLFGQSMPSAVKGTSSTSASSTQSTIASVNVPPVDAIPADQPHPIVPKVAVRKSE